MTPIEKIESMKKIFGKCTALAEKKGHDYSGSTDGMANFKTFGWKGIVVRLEDKMQRLIHFSKSGQFRVVDENIEDTLQDLINYAALAIISYREETKSANKSKFVGYCDNSMSEKVSQHDKIVNDAAINEMLNNPFYLRTGKFR